MYKILLTLTVEWCEFVRKCFVLLREKQRHSKLMWMCVCVCYVWLAHSSGLSVKHDVVMFHLKVSRHITAYINLPQVENLDFIFILEKKNLYITAS